ncbi:16S rRNA (uracil(1498)-N(3))-methyltransferase [Ruminococcaceae bacterium OttesenSCG-928-L11]|nr:16S rRNA (uracil(1498)-N(3))-methyltransferase [Ruminococcaceae bacterium OttesenSCG-928-L11]
MPRFFTERIAGDTAWIEGADAAHICRSLRMEAGDALVVCDLRGMDYDCVIESAAPEEVVLRVERSYPCVAEPRVKIRLFQALPKGDKLEYIVQKSTELGVDEIIPVLTERCISRPDGKAMDKKRQRLGKIAAEAAKQSGRGKIPAVGPLLSYREALVAMGESETALLCYENATVPLREALKGQAQSVAVLIGSEGGFSPEEAAQAAAAGIGAVSLGPRILRCETAPVCVLSAILFVGGEF